MWIRDLIQIPQQESSLRQDPLATLDASDTYGEALQLLASSVEFKLSMLNGLLGSPVVPFCPFCFGFPH